MHWSLLYVSSPFSLWSNGNSALVVEPGNVHIEMKKMAHALYSFAFVGTEAGSRLASAWLL